MVEAYAGRKELKERREAAEGQQSATNATPPRTDEFALRAARTPSFRRKIAARPKARDHHYHSV